MKFVFVVVLLLIFISSQGLAVTAGEPAPRCDRELDKQFYFDNYVNTASFKSLNPSFDQWQLQEEYVVQGCINENGNAVLRWDFVLPRSLSRYEISYSYTLYLVINWDGNAFLAHDEPLASLIETTENMPKVQEFLSNYQYEVVMGKRERSAKIGAASYSPEGSHVAELFVEYLTADRARLTISPSRIESANLGIYKTWTLFPSVPIATALVREALKKTPCSLYEQPLAKVKYLAIGSEITYKYYDINCSGFTYYYAKIDTNNGEYSVWLENKERIETGKLTLQQMQHLNPSTNLDNNKAAITVTPAEKVDYPSNQLTFYLVAAIIAIAVIAIFIKVSYKKQ